MSTSTPTTSISIPTETILVASTLPTTVPSIKKKVTARRLKVKRRGAKVEEDEGEEEDGGKVSVNEVSDSDSELSAAEDDEDEDEGSDAETEAEKLEKAKVDAEVGKDKVEGTLEKDISTSTTIIPPVILHPSWSDSPAVGEAGSTDLPVLEFSNLTSSNLNGTAKPAVINKASTSRSNTTNSPLDPSATPLTPEELAAKRLANIAQREAKSAAAKEKDPVAWDIAEKVRKEKEIEKKKEKRERSKEKKKQERLLNPRVAPTPPTTTLPPSTSTSSAPSTREPRAPKAPRASVPSRPSRTSTNSTPNAISSSSTSAPPTSKVPNTSERSNRPPHQGQGRFVPPAPFFIQAAAAREEYATKSQDPTFTPKIGRFHTHDDRLQTGSERLMTPFWRGRGKDGEFRGRGGRGRGGYSNGRGEIIEDDRPVRKVEKSLGLEIEDDDDNWGRGEAKRTTKNSSTPTTFPAVSDWTHDGFEELKVDTRPPRIQRPNEQARNGSFAGRGGRGGIRGGIQQNNGVVRGAPIQQQPLGEINPQYADLPFHPRYRFPYVAPVPAPQESPVSRHVEGDSHLFVDEGVVAAGVVKLPTVASVEVTENVQPAAEVIQVVEEVGIRVNLGGASKTVVPLSDKVEEKVELVVVPSVVDASADESPRGSTSVLYAADPKEISSPPVASASNYQPNPQQQYYQQQQQIQQQQQQIQQMQQQQQQQYGQQSYARQLPPHLQQSQHQQQHQQQNLPFAPRPQHFIPRNGSPAFYPHPQYYSPDHAFPNMSTPGATPPPLFSGAPRNSKIDIRDPSQGRSSLSAAGEAFAPRGVAPIPLQQQLPYLLQGSPHSSRDSIAPNHSPQGSNPYAYGYNDRLEGYAENGQVVYFQQPQQQQNYYDSYGGNYPQNSQQQVDPAIIQMSNGYYDNRGGNVGRGGQQQHLQQQQNYYRQDGSPPIFDSY